MRDNEVSLFDADYYLRGKETGKSLYTDYRWLGKATIDMAQAMVTYLGITSRHTVLDFGCARGYTVKAFRQLGYEAFGTDISKWALENADEEAKPHLSNGDSAPRSFDWIIAKDVLEHVPLVDRTIQGLLVQANVGVFAVVPLAPMDGEPYVIPDYEKDVTHVHRLTLETWAAKFIRPYWSVTACYRVPGVKDNWSFSATGNGFITAERVN